MTTLASPPMATAPLPAGTSDALSLLDDPLEQQRFTRTVVDSQGRRLAESSLCISGMHCAACAGLIEGAVQRDAGVVSVSVSAAGERALIRWDPAATRLSGIVAHIRSAGYDAAPDVAAAARELRRQEARAALWRLFVASFCAMQVMMMATPSYVTSGSELAPDMRQLLNWGGWVLSIPVLAFSADVFFKGAWRALRQRRIGMDVPVAIGIVVTFVASSGATFDPNGIFGHEVYFDSLTMFVSFLLGGRWLEMRMRHRAAQSLEATLTAMPDSAQRLRDDGSVETVSVRRLLVGDRVRVPVGQAFPADGVLVEGDTQADESLLTGESRPVPRPCGAAVVAGSINQGAPVLMKVLQVGGETRLSRIEALMQGALAQRPAWARVADRFAAPFLWAVLLLACGAAAVWSVVDPSRAVWVFVSVLIVTCPCALSLAAPSALLAAAGALARRGVLLQRLDALATLATLTQVVFDKTGTLTEDQLRPVGLVRLDADGATAALGDNQLRAVAASLAAWSLHPMARAVAALGEGLAPEGMAWTDIDEQAGAGLQARDAQGRAWRLGSHGFAAATVADGADDPDRSAVWLGCDGQPLARLDFDEVLRPDAAAAVAALRADAVTVSLLSGDREHRAQQIGQALGVDHALGQATPQSKLEAVRALQAQGHRVAMVGDGINDAPVLAAADVSLAMGQGALVSRAHADAVIVSNRLSDIALARRHAQRALRVVKQNLAWAAVYNLACIPLALMGWLPPWAAGLGMAGSSLLVIGNSLRLARLAP
ncbi:copper/silver-translocating P-type ATPase [Burkholderiales bacterium JOSHI_001]|nr:copper/silver-translocating P-type ATPase [Burkholderiales bacterium JOSHI_001]